MTHVIEFYHDQDFPLYQYRVSNHFTDGGSSEFYLTSDPESTFRDLVEAIRKSDFVQESSAYRGVTFAGWLDDQQLVPGVELAYGNWYIELHLVKDQL